MSANISVHDPNFKPPGGGRPPVADVSQIAYAATENAGAWVSQVMTNREANSAMGQLRRRGYNCSTAQVDADHREVFVQYQPEN